MPGAPMCAPRRPLCLGSHMQRFAPFLLWWSIIASVPAEMMQLSKDGGPKVIVAGGVRGDNVRALVESLSSAVPV